jgi:hypothetical protein
MFERYNNYLMKWSRHVKYVSFSENNKMMTATLIHEAFQKCDRTVGLLLMQYPLNAMLLSHCHEDTLIILYLIIQFNLWKLITFMPCWVAFSLGLWRHGSNWDHLRRVYPHLLLDPMNTKAWLTDRMIMSVLAFTNALIINEYQWFHLM